MKVLVVTSCTGEKAVETDRQLVLKDFEQGAKHIAAREKELGDLCRKAGEMYTGEQHVRVMRGVSAFRSSPPTRDSSLALHVLSAGYGIIPEDRVIAPYEVTFATMKAKEIDAWSKTLGVPEDFRRLVSQPYDLGLILLGDNYLRACQLDKTVKCGGPTILFCGTGMAKKFPKLANVRVVAISNPEAKRFSCGLIGLKGELAARILGILSEDAELPRKLCSLKNDVLRILDSKPGHQRGSPKDARSSAPASVSERQRFTSFTPRRDARMKYFIPEWDDRVDPDYEFLTDTVTPDRDPYAHDVYAHEIYDSPNYDGILVSKSVIEENKTKKERIRAIGIHRHIRVPRDFPVMGDCGAFNYLDEDIPPYGTEDTVEFYETLDFDYGVSVDHLIIPGHLKRTVHAVLYPDGRKEQIKAEEFARLKAEGYPVAKGKSYPRDLFEKRPYLTQYEEDDLTEGKRRWNITLNNAADFLSVHKKKACRFTPIAGCQGYDLESHVEMFRQQQAMGYKYIALGGLVRSKTSEILKLVEGINSVRKPSVKLHLFGVARPEAISDFIKAGVDSIDSARFLRQAWLSATSNYYTGDVSRFRKSLNGNGAKHEDADKDLDEKWRYAAIRVPPLQREGGESLTKKASLLVGKGWTLENLRLEECKALEALRSFDEGSLGLEETLAAVSAYDRLMGGDHRNEPHYRRLLQDKPWRSCPCAVCRKTGIDVVIFRRNNRNRRRGFHNTWWFFQLFDQLTKDSPN